MERYDKKLVVEHYYEVVAWFCVLNVRWVVLPHFREFEPVHMEMF